MLSTTMYPIIGANAIWTSRLNLILLCSPSHYQVFGTLKCFLCQKMASHSLWVMKENVKIIIGSHNRWYNINIITFIFFLTSGFSVPIILNNPLNQHLIVNIYQYSCYFSKKWSVFNMHVFLPYSNRRHDARIT